MGFLKKVKENKMKRILIQMIKFPIWALGIFLISLIDMKGAGELMEKAGKGFQKHWEIHKKII